MYVCVYVFQRSTALYSCGMCVSSNSKDLPKYTAVMLEREYVYKLIKVCQHKNPFSIRIVDHVEIPVRRFSRIGFIFVRIAMDRVVNHNSSEKMKSCDEPSHHDRDYSNTFWSTGVNFDQF